MPGPNNLRDKANQRTETEEERFFNDRLDGDYIDEQDYPTRIDQAALDLEHGVSIGKSEQSTGMYDFYDGTIGKNSFGKATGEYYVTGLKTLAREDSDLPELIGQYKTTQIGKLAYQLNKLRSDLERDPKADIDDIDRVLEAVMEKIVTRSIDESDAQIQQSIDDIRSVSELLHDIFSDPSSTAYISSLIELVTQEANLDIISILDSPEMVTPLWGHQRDAIENWVKNGYEGFVNMATATGKTVLGLAAIATLYGDLHPIDKAELDVEINPQKPDNARVLVVAGQDLLLRQWQSEFDEHFDIPRDRTKPIGDENKISLHWGDIEFKTAQNLLSANTVKEYDLVILDEAHQYTKGGYTGKGWKSVLEDLVDHSDAILAMSGSIDSEWIGDEAVERTLTGQLTLCKRYDLTQARHDGVVADFEWDIVYAPPKKGTDEELVESTEQLKMAYDGEQYAFDLSRVGVSQGRVDTTIETLSDLQSFSQSNAGSSIRQDNEDFDKISTATLSRRARFWNMSPRPKHIAEIVAKHLPENKIVVLVQSYKQAEEVGSAIRNLATDDTVLVPDSDSDEQFGAVEQYKNGDYQVIVGPGKTLGTGVDMPEADVAVNVSRGGVNASLIQRIGRILRNPTGDKEAVFYHIVALPAIEEALIPGEDGRQFVRDASNFRALGERLRELPGYNTTSETVQPIVKKLENEGTLSITHSSKPTNEIIDDEIARNHLSELTDEVGSGSVILSKWERETLERKEPEPEIDYELSDDIEEKQLAVENETNDTTPSKKTPQDASEQDQESESEENTESISPIETAGEREIAVDDGVEVIEDEPTKESIEVVSEQSAKESTEDVTMDEPDGRDDDLDSDDEEIETPETPEEQEEGKFKFLAEDDDDVSEVTETPEEEAEIKETTTGDTDQTQDEDSTEEQGESSDESVDEKQPESAEETTQPERKQESKTLFQRIKSFLTGN